MKSWRSGRYRTIATSAPTKWFVCALPPKPALIPPCTDASCCGWKTSRRKWFSSPTTWAGERPPSRRCIKTFVGTSPNALKTQIWTALIAMLLLKYLQLRSRFGWSLSNLCALLRQQLFVYRDLFSWLNDPYQPPPALSGWHDRQLALDWKAS